MIVGVIGSLLGGFLFSIIGLAAYGLAAYGLAANGLIAQILMAVVGALVFLFDLSFIK